VLRNEQALGFVKNSNRGFRETNLFMSRQLFGRLPPELPPASSTVRFEFTQSLTI
jgi:hypothetical protein